MAKQKLSDGLFAVHEACCVVGGGGAGTDYVRVLVGGCDESADHILLFRIEGATFAESVYDEQLAELAYDDTPK